MAAARVLGSSAPPSPADVSILSSPYDPQQQSPSMAPMSASSHHSKSSRNRRSLPALDFDSSPAGSRSSHLSARKRSSKHRSPSHQNNGGLAASSSNPLHSLSFPNASSAVADQDDEDGQLALAIALSLEEAGSSPHSHSSPHLAQAQPPASVSIFQYPTWAAIMSSMQSAPPRAAHQPVDPDNYDDHVLSVPLPSSSVLLLFLFT